MSSSSSSLARSPGRWVRNLFAGLRPRNRRFRPDLTRAGIAKAISATSPAFAEFSERARPAGGDDVDELIAAYFRHRQRPRFFIDATETVAAADRVATEHELWRTATIERVRDEAAEGLAIYALEGPALRPGYPWTSLEPGPGADKLYRKRPHRFAFLPRLCLAALYGESVLDDLPELLRGWIEAAESGDNKIVYNSNLAVAQRVLAVSWAWAFLSAREADHAPTGLALEGMLLRILHADLRFLGPRLGRSYANNHLLADGFIGWFAGLMWPEFVDGPGWIARYEALFDAELKRQVLPDGTSFEHSTHYHEMATEMALAYVILSRRNALHTRERIESLARRMLRFQLNLAGQESVTHAIGDAVEEPMFPLDCGDGWGTGAWTELYRGLFDPRFSAGSADESAIERAFWLLAGSLAARPSAADPGRGPDTLVSYAAGGYHIFEHRGASHRAIFRTAPAKEQPICAGHMHADLMSVCVTTAGNPFIVDAGTYSYRANIDAWPADAPGWRRYMAGPAAHNALCIAGEDPLGQPAGDFRPADNDVHAVTQTGSGRIAGAWADATLFVSGPYHGYRRGVVQLPDGGLVIYDVLPVAAANRNCHIGFQLAPGVRVMRIDETAVDVAVDDVGMRFVTSDGLLAPASLTGSREPLGGWVSAHYGELTPALQLRYPVRSGHSVAAVFIDRLSTGAPPPRVEIDALEDHGLAIRIDRHDVAETILVRAPGSTAALRDDATVFDGDLLCLRSRAAEVERIAWLGGRSLTIGDLSVEIRTGASAPAVAIRADRGEVQVEEGDDMPLTISWPQARTR